MPKQKKGLTKEEKLAKDRIRKKNKYSEIKNNPDLYALYKEKERKRYLLRKEKKKICSIMEMTPRAQREQRKRWRRNAKTYLKKKEEQKKIQKILIENSPPDSDTQDQNHDGVANAPDPLNILDIPEQRESPAGSISRPQPAEQKPISSVIRKMRYRHIKVVKALQEEIEKLKLEKKALKRKMISEIQKKNNDVDSIEKKVNNLVTEIRQDKVEEVKKQLLFNETLTRDMKEGYKTLKKKEKRTLFDTIIKDKDRLKKYKVLNKIPFRVRKELPQVDLNVIKKKIEDFFEEDINSRVAAGKKEYVRRRTIKKQKRYITDNLKNLHDKFVKEQCSVSYSTFCKYRPFWVVFPNKERDTCSCKLHCNVDLLLEALKREKITKVASGSDMIKSICCDSTNDKCLQRKCDRCKNKTLIYMEFRNDKKVFYYEWLNEKQNYTDRTGKTKIKIAWCKKKIEDYPRNIILKLDSLQNAYFKHCHTIAMQYFAMKKLKENIGNDEIVIHIDFSENFCLKYHREIQSFHFGGSRGQVSLHTGVLYYVDKKTGSTSSKSFCTMSENLDHHAGAVWAHITPILKIAQELVPYLKVIHFLSDSPSSQYRNRFIFYMITKLKQQVKDLEKVTWNYHEAGHGKGAPDGVGAVIKRTGDDYVNFGGDLGSFQAFTEVISLNVQNVHMEVVDADEVGRDRFPKNIPGFKGTMKVHQVVWCQSLPYNIAFRSLSCFICDDNYVPCSHGKHLGHLSFSALSRETASQPVSYCEDRIADDINEDDLHIDSPTLANNIRDLDSVENEIIFEDIQMPIDTAKKSKVQILSNVRVNLLNPSFSKTLSVEDILIRDDTVKHPTILTDVRTNFRNPSFSKTPPRTFNPFDQSDFEQFIQVSPISMHENSNKENYLMIDEPYEVSAKDADASDTDQKKYKNKIVVDEPQEKSPKEAYNPNSEMIVDQSKKKSVMEVDNVYNWVIVQYQIKSKLYSYIGQVKGRSDSLYKILFLKKVAGKSLKFYWPDTTDEDTLPLSRLIKINEPVCTRRGQYIFNNLPEYDYK